MDAEDLEKAVSAAEKAVDAFMDCKSPETAERADYWLSRMKLALGDRFYQLHWHSSADKEVIKYIEDQKKEHK